MDRNRGGFLGWLLTDWDLLNPGTWFKGLLILQLIGYFSVGSAAADGRLCGPGFNALNAESWIRNAFCFIRQIGLGFGNNPNDYRRDPGLDKVQDGNNLNLVKPNPNPQPLPQRGGQ